MSSIKKTIQITSLSVSILMLRLTFTYTLDVRINTSIYIDVYHLKRNNLLVTFYS